MRVCLLSLLFRGELHFSATCLPCLAPLVEPSSQQIAHESRKLALLWSLRFLGLRKGCQSPVHAHFVHVGGSYAHDSLPSSDATPTH